MAGQAVRMVDIPIDAGRGLGAFEELHGFPDGDSFSRRLKEVSGLYYGLRLAGNGQAYCRGREGVAQRVNAGIKQFIANNCPAGSDGQVQRVASRFALAACAASEAQRWGILPWPENEGYQSRVRLFFGMAGRKGRHRLAELQEGLAQVRALHPTTWSLRL